MFASPTDNKIPYRADYSKNAASIPETDVLPSGSHLIIGERRYRAARKWGLLFFADPDLPADQAALFWNPSNRLKKVSRTQRLRTPKEGHSDRVTK